MSASSLIGSFFFLVTVLLIIWAVVTKQAVSVSGSQTFLNIIRNAIWIPTRSIWIWTGKYPTTRWVVAMLLILGGYSALPKTEVFEAVQELQGNGSVVLKFKIPEGIKSQRIVFLSTLAVQISKKEFAKHKKPPLIGFKFDGVLYEYPDKTQTWFQRTMGFSEEPIVLKRWKRQKAERMVTGIRKNSELEWSGSPYIQIITKPRGIPFRLANSQVRYKIVE